jgi:16S rRNA (cytosine967-C5)-methyltransferase
VDSARANAAIVIRRVIEGEALHRILPETLSGMKTANRPLCQELVYGTLREWPMLAPLARQFLKKPLRNKDADIEALICVGLYEQSHLHTPAHAALSEAVNAAKALKKHWASGLVNGVLRSHQRSDTSAKDALNAAQRAAVPDWLYRQLLEEYGDTTEIIADASRSRPPMVLRVNTRFISREGYLDALDAAGIDAHICPELEAGIVLVRGVDVLTLPGFSDGWVSVQDRSAQLAAEVIDPQPGERILDACAAPGSKACHLLERQPKIRALVSSLMRKKQDGI